MNNTDKAKLDVARRMLKGKIEVDEVVLMTGLDKATIEKLDEEINPKNSDAAILQNLDNVDLDIGQLLYDDLPAEDEELEGFHEVNKEDNN
ncbi:MAG: hypothetical protein IJV15_15705 [Lachnospiraceae bacterium]|nr:hypothetical protein [Lachnospiraceae bacterium]